MKYPRVLIMLVISLLGGCSIWNPMISDSVPAVELDAPSASACTANLAPTFAVRRSCVLMRRIESARSAQIYAHSGMATVLIPLAAYVAYQTSRSDPPGSTGGLAMIGLGTYATFGFLIPNSRVEAYNRGAKALSCALGVYGVASATSLQRTSQRSDYESALREAKKASQTIFESVQRNKQSTIWLDFNMQLDEIASRVDSQSSTGVMEAQLDQFSKRTIVELNELLRGTLSTLSGLSREVASLSNATVHHVKRPITVQGTETPYATEYAKLHALETAAQALLEAEEGTLMPTVDLAECQISTAALIEQGIYKPLELGAGNTMNQQTRTLMPGQPLQIPLSGGLIPYAVDVSGEGTEGFPTAEIIMQGGTLLTVKAETQDPAKDRDFKITVSDAAGAQRWFTVHIPKK